jgi:putative FmdB family regulatory protein
MPKYTYHCYKCECTIDAWHPIKEVKTTCTSCGDNKLVRVPPSFTLKKKNTNSKKQKVGDVVKSSIEGFREDLKEQKEAIKKQEYKEE